MPPPVRHAARLHPRSVRALARRRRGPHRHRRQVRAARAVSGVWAALLPVRSSRCRPHPHRVRQRRARVAVLVARPRARLAVRRRRRGPLLDHPHQRRVAPRVRAARASRIRCDRGRPPRARRFARACAGHRHQQLARCTSALRNPGPPCLRRLAEVPRWCELPRSRKRPLPARTHARHEQPRARGSQIHRGPVACRRGRSRCSCVRWRHRRRRTRLPRQRCCTRRRGGLRAWIACTRTKLDRRPRKLSDCCWGCAQPIENAGARFVLR